jgi:site-specific recombinase XerD
MPEQGISPKVVQTMLGHSSVAISLDIYSHMSLYKLRVFLSGLICYPPTESNTEDSP